MAHRRSGRTFHKKTLKQRKRREAERIKDEATAHPVTVRRTSPEEVRAMQARARSRRDTPPTDVDPRQ